MSNIFYYRRDIGKLFSLVYKVQVGSGTLLPSETSVKSHINSQCANKEKYFPIKNNNR